MHYGSWDFSREPKNYNLPTITDRETGEPIRTQRIRPTTLDIIQTCKQYSCAENCGHELVTCPSSGEKIFKHRICDGENDCLDKSDEQFCDFGCCQTIMIDNQKGWQFRKKNSDFRPKRFQGYPDQSPIRRRFYQTADFVCGPDLPNH